MVVQTLCLGSVSFLFAFRSVTRPLRFTIWLIFSSLWAWYEVSARVLYTLLLVWATSLLSTLAFIIYQAGYNSQGTPHPQNSLIFGTETPPIDIVHEPFLNICISVVPTNWVLWLPSTVEHGVYAVFLLFNAMATPRYVDTIPLSCTCRQHISILCSLPIIDRSEKPRWPLSIATASTFTCLPFRYA
jgi:hypothetical protein